MKKLSKLEEEILDATKKFAKDSGIKVNDKTELLISYALRKINNSKNKTFADFIETLNKR